MALSEADIQPDLDRRRPGTSRHVTQRQEADRVEILSGVFEGLTTGTPIALLIRNEDARSKDYGNIADTFRPGHADYTYGQKYGLRDHRGGGRSSARLTAPVVAAGAVARKWLAQRHGVRVRGCMSQLGPIPVPFPAACPFAREHSGARLHARNTRARSHTRPRRSRPTSAAARR
jgi:chorismate synthase